jgi:hypothetical protein
MPWLKKLRDEGLFTGVWEVCVLTLLNSTQEVANVLIDILKAATIFKSK